MRLSTVSGTFSEALPGLVDEARQGGLGGLQFDRLSDALDVLKAYTSEITSGLGRASGGLAHVGVSASVRSRSSSGSLS